MMALLLRSIESLTAVVAPANPGERPLIMGGGVKRVLKRAMTSYKGLQLMNAVEIEEAITELADTDNHSMLTNSPTRSWKPSAARQRL